MPAALRLLPLLLFVCAGSTLAQNALRLDNGGDLLLTLNDPTVGSDPLAGDFSGDFYWKVYPATALQTPSGELELMGIDYSVFDQDWDLDGATLWASMVTVGVLSQDLGGGGSTQAPGTIEPRFADPASVFFPEVSNPGLGNRLGDGQCPPPGELAGWQVSETFIDTATGQPTPLITLVADGATDYVYTAFYPADQSTTVGGVNCGGGGNATLQFFVSADAPGAPEGGENIPDVLGSFTSPYGGRHFGDPDGGTFQFYVAQPYDRSAELAWTFEHPIINLIVDAGIDSFGPERGLAALEVPLGLEADGTPAGTQARIGFEIRADDAVPGLEVAIGFATTEPPLGLPIPVFGAELLLDPTGGIFWASLNTWGIPPIVNGPDGAKLATSPLVPVTPSVQLLDLPLWFQGFVVNLVGETARETQVARIVFRANRYL